jgi:hypothetical protein
MALPAANSAGTIGGCGFAGSLRQNGRAADPRGVQHGRLARLLLALQAKRADRGLVGIAAAPDFRKISGRGFQLIG